MVNGRPVSGLRPFPLVGGLVDAQVVPDEHNRAAELLVGHDQQVAVVAPGEAFAAVASAVIPARSIDESQPVTGL